MSCPGVLSRISFEDYLNDGGQGKLWEANGVGLSVEVFQHQVIQLVNQSVLTKNNKELRFIR